MKFSELAALIPPGTDPELIFDDPLVMDDEGKLEMNSRVVTAEVGYSDAHYDIDSDITFCLSAYHLAVPTIRLLPRCATPTDKRLTITHNGVRPDGSRDSDIVYNTADNGDTMYMTCYSNYSGGYIAPLSSFVDIKK